MFDALPAPLNFAVPFLIVLGVLVFFHEFGHYLAARSQGVLVESFSICFGRAWASWKDRHGTVWKIGWLPLGGYVKLHGMERPEDATPEARALWQPGRTFHEKSVLSRAIVIAAGPFANFLLAIVLFAGLYGTAGRPIMLPVVGEVLQDSAAAHAGLQTGDVILSIDGQPMERFEDVQHAVASHPEQQLTLRIRRGDAEQALEVTPRAVTADGQRIGRLGIGPKITEFRRLSPISAVAAGAAQTWDISRQTLVGVWQMIAGTRGTEDLGGPIRILQLSGEAAQMGVASLVSLMAVLSVSLGLINLFPIPVLDGGHLLFYLIEAVRGRPLPPRAVEYGFRAGLALLAGLFVFVTWNDLTHIGLVRWVVGLIG